MLEADADRGAQWTGVNASATGIRMQRPALAPSNRPRDLIIFVMVMMLWKTDWVLGGWWNCERQLSSSEMICAAKVQVDRRTDCWCRPRLVPRGRYVLFPTLFSLHP